MLIVRELSDLLDMSTGSAESFEHCSQVSTILHGDNSELILLIDPHQESLLIIVEDTSAVRPVSIKATGLQESIALLKKEVVLNELLSIGL